MILTDREVAIRILALDEHIAQIDADSCIRHFGDRIDGWATAEHCGDCTGFSSTCFRCVYEETMQRVPEYRRLFGIEAAMGAADQSKDRLAMTEEWTQYRRTNVAEMRPYVKGEDLSKISVAAVDNPVEDMGMVARNPSNHLDQWYVARAYFEENFEALHASDCS